MSTKRFADKHIILVDDNVDGLTVRKSLIEEVFGCTVETVKTGEAALQMITSQRVDLVITDYKMPVMNGVELINSIRGMIPEMPIIMLSGFVDVLKLTPNNTGADIVIEKSSREPATVLGQSGRYFLVKIVSP